MNMSPHVDVDVVEYLKRMQAEDPSFFYARDDNGNGNIFWADSSFRMNYNYFGDTVRLDTSSISTSISRLVSITGLNHHGQPILFGCGLLSHSEPGYVWLLQNWLHAMSGNYPVSITTEPDHHIQMAVAHVLPQTRHRFCKWTIFRETHEKLGQSQTHPDFDKEIAKCVHEGESADEFESCWQTLVERYSLTDNEWVQSIYNARHQWVPLYMQDTFFGELYQQETPTMFFHNPFVLQKSSLFVKQYESVVTSWQEMELKADIETSSSMPLLKTPSPMEKQAANLYTKRAFTKFQEELVETLANPATKIEDNGTVATYRVAKFGGDGDKVHIVRFHAFEMKVICSCHLFEFSGIICRHALSVFRAKNVLTLPSQYILKRWTRDAKKGGGGVAQEDEFDDVSDDSLSVRYNSLRDEAIKFVEQGAKSVHVYNAALDALQLAANKVAASKKQSCGVGGGNHKQPTYRGDKEKKIRELSSDLENTKERCEVYRANLLAVLRDMEEHKLKLSVKVQNARLSLKE